MQMDISASIAALLYEHKSVSIPGLGSLLTSLKPAMIDQVEGKIHPPSKQLEFNKNLAMDDGLLVQHLRDKYKVTYPTAMYAIESYVREAQAVVDKRDIFTIQGVGRLYKDYEQNFQFIPDEVNFNTESYGLPTVQFYPVVRGQKASTSAPTPTQEKKSVPKGVSIGGNFKNWLQRNLAIVSSVLVLAIAGIVYWQFIKPTGDLEPDQTEENLESSRYNVSPSRMTSDDGSESPLTNTTGDTAIDDDDSETDGATRSPQQQYCTIGVGIFGDPDNVERLVKKIYEAGYEPFTEPANNLTRVGIQLTYKTEADIQRALKDIQKQFDTKAKVLKRNQK